MQAIETSYAGCRFRSRLEARWAVFFDTMGIQWEYEAQGYLCSPRCFLTCKCPRDPKLWLTACEEKFPYLPDFWLPEHGLFAEVKGTLDQPGLYKLLDAAAYLSSPGGGCSGGKGDMIVLGPVPQGSCLPVRLHMHKGDLEATPWDFQVGCRYATDNYITVADDGSGEGAVRRNWNAVSEMLLRGVSLTYQTGSERNADYSKICPAYAAARSARFEFGERGTTAAARVTASQFPTLYALNDETHEAGCLKTAGFWYVVSGTCLLPHERGR